MSLSFKFIFTFIVSYHFKKSITRQQALGEKSVISYAASSTVCEYSATHLLTVTFLFSDGLFSNWFYLLSKWHFNRGIHSHFHSPLTFLWLRVQGAACQRLARLMLGGKKKSADSRCFFSSCCAYYFEKLTLLKNRFQMFCLSGSKSGCVTQLGEV